MARAGRKPKPTVIKLLDGNPGRRPLNDSEPIPAKGFVAEPPDWLLPDAVEEWNRLAPEMEQMGLLTGADQTAFAAYCQAYARWREADTWIRENGSTMTTKTGYMQQVPQVAIAQQCMKVMQNFMSEFGLTPASRSRIHVDVRKQETGGMAALLDMG